MKVFIFIPCLFILLACSSKKRQRVDFFQSQTLNELKVFFDTSQLLYSKTDSFTIDLSKDSVIWIFLYTRFDSLNKEIAFNSSKIIFDQLDTAGILEQLFEFEMVHEVGLAFNTLEKGIPKESLALICSKKPDNMIYQNPLYVKNWAYMINELSIAQIEELKIIYNNCLIEEGLVEAHLPFDNFLSISSNESTQLLSHVAIYSCMLHSAREYHRMDLSDHIQWLFDNSFEGHSISLDGT